MLSARTGYPTRVPARHGRLVASSKIRFSSAGRAAPVREIFSAHPDSRGSDLLISVATVRRRCVLSAMGHADLGALECMVSAVAAAVQRPEREVWIDLTHVRHMDARVARELRELQVTLRLQRRRLVVICPPGAVARALVRARLDGASTTFSDFASAHAATDRERGVTAAAIADAALESIERHVELSLN
jgi:anti-anti-sigma regulatory factor